MVEAMNEHDTQCRNGMWCGTPMVGELIRLRRAKKGLSQTELAERVGSSQRQVSRLENSDRTLPRKKTRDAFGAVLDISEAEWHRAAGLLQAESATQLEAQDRERAQREADRYADLLRRMMQMIRESAPDLDIIPSERIRTAPPRESRPFVPFPLHDIMAADHGRTTDSQIRETVDVSPELLEAARRPVVIRASGDCLALRRILTGDLVVCDARRTARENDIVAFRFQGYAGLKIYREEGERIALCPSIESREFQAIYVPKDQVADLDIVGVAIGVVAQDGRNWWRL